MQKELRNISTAVNSCYNCKSDVKIPSCINDDYCISSPMPKNEGILAMAFVDMQPLDSVYSEDLALCSGTLFPNLDMPFYGGRNK